MDIAVSTCSLLLSVQFLLIKLSSTLCYRKVLNQGHCLLSDERKQFSAFILLCLLISQQRHLLNLFLMETFSTAQTSFLLPWGVSWCASFPCTLHFILPACLFCLSESSHGASVSESLCVANPLFQTLHRNSDWDQQSAYQIQPLDCSHLQNRTINSSFPFNQPSSSPGLPYLVNNHHPLTCTHTLAVLFS